MKCAKCNGTDIKRRSNYSHGKKSKPIVTCQCKSCGSTQMIVERPSYGRKRR